MAAWNGVMTLRGKSGATYSPSIYGADSAGTPIKFSGSGKAVSTSPSEWIPQEPVVIMDCMIITGGSKTLQITRDNTPTGDLILEDAYLTSVVNRTPLRIPFGKGQRVGAVEIA